ncbi:hypothetical protein EDF46_2616 [Frondihabitans sp. PhB188]|uniref:hypothetical protein n=1 Tax=Frondihabitans sp. PhB188 TaxID=2485200 RepID=UPI000F4A6366|nr:hypothetical protein [Frondihabitans sp. PhB188]ROQ37166.1 hypothetical protein EDF46_2616 [Frondihabitans sp. PhB188]
MTAGTTATATALLPAIVIDPVDYLLVDIATGRHLPGDGVHVEQLAHEHGLSLAEAGAALDEAWCLGLVSRRATTTGGIVCWTPEATQVMLHRLARAMVSAVTAGPRCDAKRGLIDGDAQRFTVVELFGLTAPCDVALFLEVARALLGAWAPDLLDELIMPVAVLFSQSAQRVHGFEPAAEADVRCEMVRELVSSLIDGRTADFESTVADYVLALSTH